MLAAGATCGYFFYKNQSAIKEYDDNQVTVAKQTEKKNTLTKEKADLAAKIVQLKDQLNAKSAEITKLDNLIKDMNNNKTSITEKIKVVEGEIKNQETKLGELDQQIRAKKEDIKKQEAQIAELEQKIAALKTEHDRVKSLLTYYIVGGGASLLANVGGGVWWYLLSQNIKNNTNVSIDLNNTLNGLKLEIKNLNQNITDQREINNRLNETIRQKNIDIENLTKVEKGLIDDIKVLNATRDELVTQCEKIKNDTAELEKKITQKGVEYQKLQEDFNNLQKAYDALNKTYNDTKSAIENMAKNMEILLKKKYDIGNETELSKKIYANALAKNKILIENSTALNVTHSQASANFTNLTQKFKEINATYTQWIQNHTHLKGNYTLQNDTYYKLLKDYDDLNKTYALIKKELEEVNGNITELEKKNLEVSNKLIISSLDNIKMHVLEDVYNIKVNVAGTCYNSTQEGFVKAKFANDCANKVNSLFLIETVDKSYFGGFIENELKLANGTYPDAKAFTFSINNDELCTEHKVDQSYNVNDTTFFIFGTGDIVIFPQVPENKNWTTGAVNANMSYIIPQGYDKNFYHNGDSVNITYLQVQQLAVTP
jgi:septal ring factor EnvC (AmiA/AmiB activator)